MIHLPAYAAAGLFQPDYIARLMEIGEADAEAASDQVDELLDS